MDPYENLLAENPYDRGEKTRVAGDVVVLLDVRYESGRGLELIAPLSRALPEHEIHEVILTAEDDPREDGVVDTGTVLGFVEFRRGGVVAVGDEVRVGGEAVGTVVGFDASHAPNHYNVVVEADDPETGVEMDVDLGTTVTFG